MPFWNTDFWMREFLEGSLQTNFEEREEEERKEKREHESSSEEDENSSGSSSHEEKSTGTNQGLSRPGRSAERCMHVTRNQT